MLATVITGIVGCITGNIMMFLFLPQEKRAKDIANEARQSEEWQKLYREANEEIKHLSSRIDTLYIEISKHRDEKAMLALKIAELEVEKVKLKMLKCDVPACSKREPPTGY